MHIFVHGIGLGVIKRLQIVAKERENFYRERIKHMSEGVDLFPSFPKAPVVMDKLNPVIPKRVLGRNMHIHNHRGATSLSLSLSLWIYIWRY